MPAEATLPLSPRRCPPAPGRTLRNGRHHRRRWLTAIVLFLLASLAAAPQLVAQQPTSRPIILLTGFQPFGEKRSPNPSWEAIRDLDGRTWKDYQLACLELPVEWGQPRSVLEKWLATHRPVAVFSFGQGMPDGFAIETLARNRRGPGRDNNDAAAPAPEIVPGGPGRINASFDAPRLLQSLQERGYPVRISTNAGAYLCEELLYTLETLRSEGQIDGSVLFCHVPPLGVTLPEHADRVTPESVQKFVLDVLESWHAARTAAPPAAQATPPAVVAQAAPPAGGVARGPRHAEVEKLIRHYFDTWSRKDIDGYGRCFHPEATIHLLDEGGKVTQYAKRPFVEWQRQVHRRSEQPLVEAPVTINITFERDVARAEVYWKLTQGERVEVGYDHFTLIRQGERWLILHLLFYSTRPEG